MRVDGLHKSCVFLAPKYTWKIPIIRDQTKPPGTLHSLPPFLWQQKWFQGEIEVPWAILKIWSGVTTTMLIIVQKQAGNCLLMTCRIINHWKNYATSKWSVVHVVHAWGLLSMDEVTHEDNRSLDLTCALCLVWLWFPDQKTSNKSKACHQYNYCWEKLIPRDT